MCNNTVVLSPVTITASAPTATLDPEKGPEQACSNNGPLEAALNKRTNMLTGLAVALGCLGMTLAALFWDWNRKRKQLVLPSALRK
jgi:hypothetical protein